MSERSEYSRRVEAIDKLVFSRANIDIPSCAQMMADLIEYSLEDLRNEIEECQEKQVKIGDEILEIVTTNSKRSRNGNDLGFLHHSRGYYDARVSVLKAELSRRRDLLDEVEIQDPLVLIKREGEKAGRRQGVSSGGAAKGSEVKGSERRADFNKRDGDSNKGSPKENGSASSQPSTSHASDSLPHGEEPSPGSSARHSSNTRINGPASVFRPAPVPEHAPKSIADRRLSAVKAVSSPRTESPYFSTITTDEEAYFEDFNGSLYDHLGAVDHPGGNSHPPRSHAKEPESRPDDAPPRSDTSLFNLQEAPSRNPPPLAESNPFSSRKGKEPRPSEAETVIKEASPLRSQTRKTPTKRLLRDPESEESRNPKSPRTVLHPWTRDVQKALIQRFKLTGFRPHQEEAIDATLSGRDVFVLLPTGGGKSLCFQLPAVVSTGTTRGVTVVVSPLLSLIDDQCRALIEKDIPAAYINSEMPAQNRNFVLNLLKSDPPLLSLVYITPEQLIRSNAFKDTLEGLHRRRQLSRFVLDEAHCISSWGHDFRPDYKEMGMLKQQYPDIPLIALTATANPRVKTDILSSLGLRNPLVLTHSFNRPNLHYEVRTKGKNLIDDLARFILEPRHARQSGIIYCLSKNDCETTAYKLRTQFRISARHYHAGMDKHERVTIQRAWQAGTVKVICATIAFGMGIDKANVRYVVHHTMSKSLEGYYQETGRAGRDGKTSVCVLYFSYGDTKKLNSMIDNGEGTAAQKESNRENIRHMVAYCLNNADCRRTQVLQYFGERFDAKDCHGTCDVCRELLGSREPLPSHDVTELAKDIVRLVGKIQKEHHVTMLYAVDVFRGSRTQKIVAAGHHTFPESGKGAHMDRSDIERLFHVLASKNVIGERYQRNRLGFTHAYIVLASASKQLLGGKMQISMTLRTARNEASDRAAPRNATAAAHGPRAAEARKDSRTAFDALLTSESEVEEFATPANSMRSQREAPITKKASPRNDPVARCLRELTTARNRSARSKKIAPELVASDALLEILAQRTPLSFSEFTSISGCTEDHYDWFVSSGAKQVCAKYRDSVGPTAEGSVRAPAQESTNAAGSTYEGGAANYATAATPITEVAASVGARLPLRPLASSGAKGASNGSKSAPTRTSSLTVDYNTPRSTVQGARTPVASSAARGLSSAATTTKAPLKKTPSANLTSVLSLVQKPSHDLQKFVYKNQGETRPISAFRAVSTSKK